MKQKITISNIKSYIEGNTRLFLSSIGAQPEHLQEQYAYRMLQCKDDCMITNQCKECGCDTMGKIHVSKSCNNGERFPDLMSATDWEEFKTKNEI